MATRQCSTCGAALPERATHGQCPECLLNLALDAGAPDGAASSAKSQIGNRKSQIEKVRYFGDYELLEEIARGGMGVVYRARQVSLNRIVAVKMILAGHFAGAESVKRFRAEAEAAASLRHPNIVAIHEVGEHEGQQYFSMDYIDGQNLADLVREKPLAAKRAASLVKIIAEAIQFAHEGGVLHRDLKPSNVLIDAFDAPHVTDFGLAKRFGIPSSGGPLGVPALAGSATGPPEGGTPNEITLSGQVLGSPSYIPPEQASGKRGAIGPTGDVYSLGAILYHLLIGRAPFLAESVTDTLQQVLHSEPVSPRRLNPAVPNDLETICLKCLEKDPTRRYERAEDLAMDLDRFLNNEAVLARPPRNIYRFQKFVRRNKVAVAAAVIVAIVLVLGALVSTWQAIRANRATADAKEKLHGSYLAQAQARRLSGRMGRRFESLEALRKAAEIHPSLELRNEAIACMALADLRLFKKWNGFSDGVTSFEFDPPAKRYATGDREGNVLVRNVEGEREVARFPRFEPPIRGLWWSPDGRLMLVTYGESNLGQVWELGEQSSMMRLQLGPCFTGAFSGDSKRLAIVGFTGIPVDIYDLPTQKRIASFKIDSPPSGFSLNPAGERLAIFAGNRLTIRNLQSGEEIDPFRRFRDQAFADLAGLAWHPNGQLLAVTTLHDRGTTWLWHTNGAEGEYLTPFAGSVPLTARFSPSGRFLASTCLDGTLRLSDPVAGKQLLRLAMWTDLPPFIADDGWMAWRREGTEIGLLELNSAPECRRLGLGANFAHSDSTGHLLLTGHRESGFRIWDIAAHA